LPYHSSRCVYHCPPQSKGISVEEFNGRIFEKIKIVTEHNEHEPKYHIQWDYDFKGFIFPGFISFAAQKFKGHVEFIGAEFHGGVTFASAKFKGITDFDRTKFNNLVDFFEGHFQEDVNFAGAQFSDVAQFSKVTFSEKCDFSRAVFSGDVEFRNADFLKGANFKFAQFDQNAIFEKNIIGGAVYFEEISFGKMVRFYFRAAQLKTFGFVPDTRFLITVIFEKVLFNPFQAHFESNRLLSGEELSSKPIFIFRHCVLKDIYFTDNDMTLFSFYKSSFDRARFISSTWNSYPDHITLNMIRYNRNNVIPEDIFIRIIKSRQMKGKKSKELINQFRLEGLNNFEDVASLYRRMKTALDNTKDYQQASWFYFNEFEMKRLALEDVIENNPSRIKKIIKKIFSKYILYISYKIFAGYGEKPLWSFLWLVIFSIFFALLHFLSGLDPIGVQVSPPTIGIHHYDSIQEFISLRFLRDIAISFIHSLSRAIPVNYLGVSPSGYWDSGLYGQIITFLNSVVLLILLIFIGIGLKRHFRRF